MGVRSKVCALLGAAAVALSLLAAPGQATAAQAAATSAPIAPARTDNGTDQGGRWKPTTGGWFNDPWGDAEAKYRIERQIVAAINHARVGAQKIWAGKVDILPNARTGVHHHGPLESVIFVVKGHARMRWGERLEFVADAFPGDFIYVPPYVPHQEINADPQNPLECVLVRSDNEAVVVNITDVEPVEPPEEVLWIDPIHKA